MLFRSILIDEGIVCDDVSRARLLIAIGHESGFISDTKRDVLEREMASIDANLAAESERATEADKSEAEKN